MEDRLPDRGSVLVKDGEEWTVVDLTKRHARLVGNTATLDVPVYAWPAGFAPLVPEQEPADISLRALLVGGDAGGFPGSAVDGRRSVVGKPGKFSGTYELPVEAMAEDGPDFVDEVTAGRRPSQVTADRRPSTADHHK